MPNVSPIPSQYILRTYDLKGSTQNRNSIPENQRKEKEKDEEQLKKVVLKDLDFDYFDKKIYLVKQDCAKLIEILQRDTKFFQ